LNLLLLSKGLEKADARSPVVLVDGFGVHDDLVRKGVGIGGGDGRDVVFVSVDDGDDLMRRLLQRLCHGATDFEHICKGLVFGLGCKKTTDTTYLSRSVAERG